MTRFGLLVICAVNGTFTDSQLLTEISYVGGFSVRENRFKASQRILTSDVGDFADVGSFPNRSESCFL